MSCRSTLHQCFLEFRRSQIATFLLQSSDQVCQIPDTFCLLFDNHFKVFYTTRRLPVIRVFRI